MLNMEFFLLFFCESLFGPKDECELTNPTIELFDIIFIIIYIKLYIFTKNIKLYMIYIFANILSNSIHLIQD